MAAALLSGPIAAKGGPLTFICYHVTKVTVEQNNKVTR